MRLRCCVNDARMPAYMRSLDSAPFSPIRDLARLAAIIIRHKGHLHKMGTLRGKPLREGRAPLAGLAIRTARRIFGLSNLPAVAANRVPFRLTTSTHFQRHKLGVLQASRNRVGFGIEV
jgi:hypothetical protein